MGRLRKPAAAPKSLCTAGNDDVGRTSAAYAHLGTMMSAAGAKTLDRAFVLSGACALVALSWHQMAIVGDGFWYIATGRLIIDGRGLPHDDPFSFASAPGKWHVVNAASAVLFAAVADGWGLRALMVMATLVEGAAATFLWLSSATTRLSKLALLPLALLFVQIDAQDLSARGQVFGDLGFVLLLWLLFRMRDGRKVHPLAAFALGVIWVNLHLSFQMAFVIPLVFAAILCFEAPEKRPPLRPFVVFAACAFCGFLVNPYGARYLPVIWNLTFAPATATFDLFQSPDFHDPIWLVAPALALAIAAWCYSSDAPWRRSNALLLLAFVYAACVSRRYVTQLVAVESVVLGALLATWEPARLARLVPAASALAAVVLLASSVSWTAEKKDPLRDVPADAAKLVRERDLPGNVMNPLHWGGYLAYAWAGRPRYFIDGRDHVILFGNGAFDDSSALWVGATQWREILDAYAIRTVVWERGAPLDWLLAQDGGWVNLHRDRIAVVYTRR